MIRVGLALGASWLGSVNYYRNLVNAIRALPDRQIEPVLLLGQRAKTDIERDLGPIEVIRSPWLDPLTPRWAVRKAWQQAFACDPFLERFLRSEHIDVLSHSDFLGRDSAVPTICWIGDFQHREFPRFFTKSERLYRDHDFRMQCRHASRILVSSHDAQQALARFEPAAIEKSRVLQFVAQPGVGVQMTDLPTLRRKYGFSGPYLHVPNQFWAHKNHQLILDALALLKVRGESVLVISTGATEDYRQPRYFEQLMARADALGVVDRFRTLGVIPHADLVGLMVNAVALVNPSRAEGWSTSVEEAKSLGKRIILSDIAVHREQAPVDGMYVDPDDAVSLANAMWRVWTTFEPQAEAERSMRARDQLPTRVRDFAESYQAIVLEALATAGGTRRKRRIGSTASPPFVAGRPVIFTCPRCGSGLRPALVVPQCEGCDWTGAVVAGVQILLPDVSLASHDELDHDHSLRHKAAQQAHFDRADEEAFETDRPHGTPHLYRFLLGEKFRRAVGPIGPQLGTATALTVCGGSGMDAEYLSRAGASVISSDISLGAAQRATMRSQKHGLAINSIVADVEHLPFADASVDLVAVHDGLHHLDDPYAGLSEMARVARRWVIVTEPARASITHLAVEMGLALETEAAGNRVARLEPSEVAGFLHAHGYVVLRAERYAMYYPHRPGRVFSALSRPVIFPVVRAGWRMTDRILGRFGNKMIVVAERPAGHATDRQSRSTTSAPRPT